MKDEKVLMSEVALLYYEKKYTQQEIADDLEISRVTVNKIIGELKNSGYLEQDGKHVGRYILTEKALSVIETFRMIENK